MDPVTILVTNDDGPDSPLLPFFLDVLSEQNWCREMRAVIPSREQSWISTAISRFIPLSVRSGEMNGHKISLVTGTPADCVSLGIYNLFPDRPDFVFSGINLGSNAGLAFFLSSGTVGGAIEGFLARVPSLAFSLEVPSEVFQLWHHRRWEDLKALSATWRQVAEVAVCVGLELIRVRAWEGCDILSVNLPWGVQLDTPRVLTSLEQTRYKPLFVREDNSFVHRMQGLYHLEELLPEGSVGDLSTLNRGEISITPIRFGALSNGKLS